MSARFNCILATTGGVLLSLAIVSPANGQIRYTPWRQTSDCRAARAPSGAFRGNTVIPQTAGGSQARECKWVRDVEECPRIRENIRHPIQCATRKQQSGYSLFQPRD